ncbi:hypothetical protein [Nocardioides dilutus]
MTEETLSVRAGLLVLGLAFGAVLEVIIIALTDLAGLGWTAIFVVIGVIVCFSVALLATRLRNAFGMGLVLGTVAPLVLGLVWVSLLADSLGGG